MLRVRHCHSGPKTGNLQEDQHFGPLHFRQNLTPTAVQQQGGLFDAAQEPAPVAGHSCSGTLLHQVFQKTSTKPGAANVEAEQR